MADNSVLWDRDTDTNVTASRLLDADHAFVGVSEFNDDIADHCDVCKFAVGWYEMPKPLRERWFAEYGHYDHLGHATYSSVGDVERWLRHRTGDGSARG